MPYLYLAMVTMIRHSPDGRRFDRRQVEATYISCAVLYCEHFYPHDFEWSTLEACAILWQKKIRNVDNFESHMPMAGDMFASCKATTRAENFAFQAPQFQNTGVHRNGLYWCFMGLISYAWSHSLTRTRNLIYVLRRLAPIVAIRIVHMVFPSKITSRYFTWFTNVIFKIWRYSTGLGPRQKK